MGIKVIKTNKMLGYTEYSGVPFDVAKDQFAEFKIVYKNNLNIQVFNIPIEGKLVKKLAPFIEPSPTRLKPGQKKKYFRCANPNCTEQYITIQGKINHEKSCRK